MKITSGNKSINIAKGVIIGAAAVVIKSLDKEYGIYAGVSAKFIKKGLNNEF